MKNKENLLAWARKFKKISFEPLFEEENGFKGYLSEMSMQDARALFAAGSHKVPKVKLKHNLKNWSEYIAADPHFAFFDLISRWTLLTAPPVATWCRALES